MPAQSTISILESIKKKLQKFDEPSQKQETFADVKDEFEYISQSQAQSANQSKNSDDIYGNNDQGNDLTQAFDDELSSNSSGGQLNQNLSLEENSLPDFDATFSSEETNFNTEKEASNKEKNGDELYSNSLNNTLDAYKNNSAENLNEIDHSLHDLDVQDQNEDNFEIDNSMDNKTDNISEEIQDDLGEDEFSYEEQSDVEGSNSQEGNRFEVSRLIDEEPIMEAEDDGNDHEFSHLEDEDFDSKEHFVEEQKDLNNISNQNSNLEIDSTEFGAKNNFEEIKSVENKISIDLDNIALKAKNIEALDLQNNGNQKNLSTKVDSDRVLEFDKRLDIQDKVVKSIDKKTTEDDKIFEYSSNSSISKDANVESLISNDLAKKTAQSISKLIGAKNTVNNVNKFVNGEDILEIASRLMEPKIEKWLEDNLPDIVERAVEKEIARIIEKSEI